MNGRTEGERTAASLRTASERRLRRVYERLGTRVVPLIVAFGLAAGAVTILATWVWMARYMGLPASDFWLFSGISAAVLAVAATALVYEERVLFRTLLSWSQTEHRLERAADVWNAAVKAPYITAVRMAVVTAVGGLTIAVAFTILAHDRAVVALAIFVAGLIGGVAGGVFLSFVIELVLRPMVEDAVSYLADDFAPSINTGRVRWKAVAPLAAVSLFSALAVGAFADLAAPGAARFFLTIGIALATITGASVIFLTVTGSLLAPLDQLLAATRRVRDGAIGTRVPVLTGDELGEVSHSFNQMLADLRRHQEQLQASRERIVAAADQERRRVERDLHDGAQQQLVLLGLKLGMLHRRLADDTEASGLVDELQTDLAGALSELRDLAHGIYPAALESDGPPGALQEAVQRAAIPAELDCNGAGRYPAEIEAAVYFCCLEALQNAAKQAGPGADATVRLAPTDVQLTFEVADNGHGFAGATIEGSHGLQNMSDRVGALGGQLRVRSQPGEGTTITGDIPLSDLRVN